MNISIDFGGKLSCEYIKNSITWILEKYKEPEL